MTLDEALTECLIEYTGLSRRDIPPGAVSLWVAESDDSRMVWIYLEPECREIQSFKVPLSAFVKALQQEHEPQ